MKSVFLPRIFTNCDSNTFWARKFKDIQIESFCRNILHIWNWLIFFTGYLGAKIIHYDEIKIIWRKMEFYRIVYNCRSSSLALLLCCFYLACLHILSRTHHKKRKIRLECRQCKKWYTMVQSPYFYPDLICYIRILTYKKEQFDILFTVITLKTCEMVNSNIKITKYFLSQWSFLLLQLKNMFLLPFIPS